MKTRKASVVGCCAVAIVSVLTTGLVRAGTEGVTNTFYGLSAGASNSGSNNSFFGAASGYYNTTGSLNTSVGRIAGYSNQTGSRNVFLGYSAGSSETGSNKLYIDNCYLSGFGGCTFPFIYGEFDTHLLKINGVVGVSANSVAKSQLHFSLAGTDTGGWFTSVLDNNFFMSSGASYDASAGGWIQKSADTNAVMAGSGGAGYRVFTHTGGTVGAVITPVARLHLDYAGNLGLNTAAVAGVPIATASGAFLSAGGVWTSVSSRAAKENIRELTTADALRALAELNPVTYNYKVDAQEKHVGFIAEDVPELVASKDRKGLSALDIVAVLTKVVQEQKRTLEEKSQMVDEQKKVADDQKRALERLESTVNRLEAELNGLKNRDVIAQR
jgi:Chaperone of endosialidase